MNSHLNLPPEQRRVQRLVDQFNADEEILRKLAIKRRLRGLRHAGLSPQQHKLHDLIDLRSARPLRRGRTRQLCNASLHN